MLEYKFPQNNLIYNGYLHRKYSFLREACESSGDGEDESQESQESVHRENCCSQVLGEAWVKESSESKHPLKQQICIIKEYG